MRCSKSAFNQILVVMAVQPNEMKRCPSLMNGNYFRLSPREHTFAFLGPLCAPQVLTVRLLSPELQWPPSASLTCFLSLAAQLAHFHHLCNFLNKLSLIIWKKPTLIIFQYIQLNKFGKDQAKFSNTWFCHRNRIF